MSKATGTKDPLYDLILVTQQALEDCFRYQHFADDAREGGDDELADLFEELATQDRELADRLKGILAKRLGSRQPGSRTAVTLLVDPSADRDPVGPGLPRRLPSPRGPITDQLLAHLTRPVHELSPLPLTEADPVTDDDLALALYLCYELHYLGLPDVDEAWEWEPTLLRERRRLEHDLERRLVELVGQVPHRGVPRSHDRGAAAPGDHRRRPLAVDLHARAGDPRADARVRGAPLRLPAQGGRSPQLGDPAAHGPRQGGAHRHPAGRVRRGPPGRRARQPVRRGDGRARARLHLRRLRRPRPRRHPHHLQRRLDVRPAPPLARRPRGPPRPVRDVQRRPDGSLPGRPASGSGSARRRPGSTPST